MTTTTTETDAFIDARAEEIRRRIMDAVERAASEVFDDEAIAAKYRSVSYEAGTARIGFRDGIGFEIRVVEVYRPETPAEFIARERAAIEARVADGALSTAEGQTCTEAAWDEYLRRAAIA